VAGFSSNDVNYTSGLQLKNWHLEGTAKLIFKPLTGTIPGFGAVLVSLTEPVSIMKLQYMALQCSSFVRVIMCGFSISVHSVVQDLARFNSVRLGSRTEVVNSVLINHPCNGTF